ncbi:MAG TPA: hypothetical protein VFZ22_01770 [Pyrinomonadaceae bacterium]|nr:hypothetical protein [Pyrinomonadaceae bacterium]
MNKMILATIAILSMTAGSATTVKPAADVFTGTSPCAEFVKPFLAIPLEQKCDRIIWQLSIRPSSKTFDLTREYGFYVDNRTYQSHGSASLKGTLTATKGRASDPGATVFQLVNEKSKRIAFAAVDENVLHLLDTDQRLAIGDAGASYTINRLNGSQTAVDAFTNANQPFTESDASAKSSFAGRSPCQEIARELKRHVAGDCLKLKWSLQLYRDPQTFQPTTYLLRGTLYRNDSNGTERPREGKWKVIRGTKADPNAVIYQLDAFGADGPIYLLKGDRGVLFFLANNGYLLVGDKDFSYTLNRFE